MRQIFNRIRQYNPWDGRSMPAGFIRTEYLNRIIKFLGNNLIKVLVGQRRVGKSYLMRQLINFLIKEKSVNPKNIFYLNKEYVAFGEIKTVKDIDRLFDFYKKELDVTAKIYVFLDEVQNIEAWESFVNSYSQDFTNEYEIFVTGSNSNLLSGELASLLSGRFIEFEIFPFSLLEFTSFKNIPVNKLSFLSYIQTGGMPEMLLMDNIELQRYYIESLRNTIVLRDIIQRHQIKDAALLDDIFRFISSNIGNLTSLTGIVKYFKSKQKKTNYETLSSYMEYLKSTFIIHEAERFNLRGKQALGGERKYYLNDLSFKNFLVGYYPADIGFQLENYVYLQLRRLGYRVSVGVLNNKEIDFVAQLNEKIMYIQVAYMLSDKTTIEREFGNLLAIKDNYEKMVITMDDTVFSDYEGIKHIRPWELQ